MPHQGYFGLLEWMKIIQSHNEGVWRVSSGIVHLFLMHETLSLTLQHWRRKLGMWLCMFGTPTSGAETGRPKSSLVSQASWNNEIPLQWETLSQGNKGHGGEAEENTWHLSLPSKYIPAHSQVWVTHIHHTHSYNTHQKPIYIYSL